MDLELPEYVLLALAVLLGIVARHWWLRRTKRSADPTSDDRRGAAAGNDTRSA